MSRPVVGTYGAEAKVNKNGVKLPHIFSTPIRDDVIRDVHTRMSKNHRQAYSVSKVAGEQTSAISWGTGRAVARIPRVSGGGTHRSGQGAFGNMCRKGRMFAPTRIWRRWHRRINIDEKRYALASAIAGSAVPALVMARGHRISGVPEVPLVVENTVVDTLTKTKAAVAVLKQLNAYEDCRKVHDNKVQRQGNGKARNRRWRRRIGPLVVYKKDGPMRKAFRNIPGIDFCAVSRLNLLQLAPGGHVGRFVIWTKDAFEALDTVYGNGRPGTSAKKGYTLPRPQLTNADIFRIINSEEIQGNLRAKRRPVKKYVRLNPLKNHTRMQELNPSHNSKRRANHFSTAAALKKKVEIAEAIKKGTPTPAAVKTARKARLARKAKFSAQSAQYVKQLA